jgi:hypothetical protein
MFILGVQESSLLVEVAFSTSALILEAGAGVEVCAGGGGGDGDAGMMMMMRRARHRPVIAPKASRSVYIVCASRNLSSSINYRKSRSQSDVFVSFLFCFDDLPRATFWRHPQNINPYLGAASVSTSHCQFMSNFVTLTFNFVRAKQKPTKASNKSQRQ